MENKVCIVTGANAGIGLATTRNLAKRGATVVMICRSEAKGAAARQRIIAETGNERVHLQLADLSDQTAIRQAAAAVRASFPSVDVLINNAATVVSEHRLSPDGVELQLAVNHLGYFLLTQQLLGTLLAGDGARIINVSSANHARGAIHFDDLNLTEEYHVLKAYNQSKLANVLFTYELDRRLQQRGLAQLTVNCLDPGTVHTDIGVKATSFWHALAWKLRRLVSTSATEAAQCPTYLAAAEEVADLSGRYWYRSKPKTSAPQSYDEAAAQRLWKISEQYCGMDDFFRFP